MITWRDILTCAMIFAVVSSLGLIAAGGIMAVIPGNTLNTAIVMMIFFISQVLTFSAAFAFLLRRTKEEETMAKDRGLPEELN